MQPPDGASQISHIACLRALLSLPRCHRMRSPIKIARVIKRITTTTSNVMTVPVLISLSEAVSTFGKSPDLVIGSLDGISLSTLILAQNHTPATLSCQIQVALVLSAQILLLVVKRILSLTITHKTASPLNGADDA